MTSFFQQPAYQTPRFSRAGINRSSNIDHKKMNSKKKESVCHLSNKKKRKQRGKDRRPIRTPSPPPTLLPLFPWFSSCCETIGAHRRQGYITDRNTLPTGTHHRPGHITDRDISPTGTSLSRNTHDGRQKNYGGSDPPTNGLSFFPRSRRAPPTREQPWSCHVKPPYTSYLLRPSPPVPAPPLCQNVRQRLRMIMRGLSYRKILSKPEPCERRTRLLLL